MTVKYFFFVVVVGGNDIVLKALHTILDEMEKKGESNGRTNNNGK